MKLIFNIEKSEAERRLKKIDFVCTDLDECLFPFYTQVLVVGELILEAIFKKNKWKYLPRLLFGSTIIAVLIVFTLGYIKILGNKFLMRSFSWTVRGIPLQLICRHSQYIHNYFYVDSLSFLKLLAQKKIKLSVISLSIQPILNELQANIGFIDYVVGNEIKVDKNNNFYSYSNNIRSGAQDKLKAYLKLIELESAKTPLVIGHSDDEMALVKDAREKNGLSIGINPKKYLYNEFDIVLESVNWTPLLEFTNETLL